MRSLKSKLPALSALLTFEAAARHGSFSRAADELCVSLAAVSAQIRRLENRLGVALFQRKHRAVELTRQGLQLQKAVQQGFAEIAEAVKDISVVPRTEPIHVGATVAFATYWFAPLLNEFRARHPEVEVRVLAYDRQLEQLSETVDLALTCGWGETPGWVAEPLFPEVIFPVCSPEYLAAHPIARIEELPRHNLLHLDLQHWQDLGWDAVDWRVWLGMFGIDYQPGHPTVSYNNYPMLVEAALAGEGIALGWRHLSERMIAQGRLVRPLAEEWEFQRSYYLAVRDGNRAAPGVMALRSWLLDHR